jgi:hypothetical protein
MKCAFRGQDDQVCRCCCGRSEGAKQPGRHHKTRKLGSRTRKKKCTAAVNCMGARTVPRSSDGVSCRRGEV